MMLTRHCEEQLPGINWPEGNPKYFLKMMFVGFHLPYQRAEQ